MAVSGSRNSRDCEDGSGKGDVFSPGVWRVIVLALLN